jgi:hypothetical protein
MTKQIKAVSYKRPSKAGRVQMKGILSNERAGKASRSRWDSGVEGASEVF